MKRTLAFVCLLSACSLLPVRADDSEDRSDLVSAYQSMTEAYLSKDPRALEKLIAPSFTCDSNGKTLNHAQWMAGALRAARFTRDMTVKIESMKVEGDQASCVTVFTSVLEGRDRSTGQTHRELAVERDNETWIRLNGDWKLFHSVTLAGRARSLDVTARPGNLGTSSAGNETATNSTAQPSVVPSIGTPAPVNATSANSTVNGTRASSDSK
jgi:hypothetical protein